MTSTEDLIVLVGRILFAVFFIKVRDRARHLARRRVSLIAVFVVLAALYFHRLWVLEDADQRQTQAQSFYRNVALLGASLAVMGFFVVAGEGLRSRSPARCWIRSRRATRDHSCSTASAFVRWTVPAGCSGGAYSE